MALVKKKTSPTSAALLMLCSRRWTTAAMVLCVGVASLFWLYMNQFSSTKINPASYLLLVGTTTTTANNTGRNNGTVSSTLSSSVLRSTLGTTDDEHDGMKIRIPPPPPPLDPQIRLVPLPAFHPCDKDGAGTVMPLHVTCLTTILVENYDNDMSIFERAIPSNPQLLTFLCQDFQSSGHEEAVLWTCLQTPNFLAALIRQPPVHVPSSSNQKNNNQNENNNAAEKYSLVFPSEASTIVSSVLHDVQQQQQQQQQHSNNNVGGVNVRIVERKTAVMHGYYPPRSPAHDAYRGVDENSGNFLWSFGATRMFNPATTLLLWDAEYYKQLSNAPTTPIIGGTNGVVATASPTASAYIIATANALNLEKPGVHTGLLNAFYQRMQLFQVPVMVMGLGMQATFEFIENVTTTTTSTTSTERWVKDTTQPAWTGDPVYEAVTGKIHLYDDQLRVLRKIQQMQPPGTKGIGVRGELTRIVCSNSGIQNCIATGCPTLLVSRHANLGMELRKKWQALQQDLMMMMKKSSLRKKSVLNITLTLPAINNVPSDARDYSMLVDLLLRIAQQSSQHRVVFNIQAPYDEPRLVNFVNASNDPAIQSLLRDNNKLTFQQYNNVEEWLADSAQMDLVISTRIHGSMAGIATAVPTIVIPTDHRIQELVDSMYLPHLTMTDVAELLNSTTTTTTTTTSPSARSSSSDNVNALLLEILKRARYQDFDHFEQNRINKMRQWHDMISATGLEMDPALVKILKSSSSSSLAAR